MKKFLLILLLHFTVVVIVEAQDHWCGTPATSSKWLENYLNNRGAYPKSDELLYLPVTIQIIGSDEGGGYVPVKNVLNAFCRLNKDFAPTNIQFYIEGEIRYINRTEYYDHNRTSIGGNIGRDYNIANTINCYWVTNAGGNGVAAYAFLGSNTVVLGQKNVNENNNFWAHEMGHALDLPHTFFGWEGYDHNFSVNAPEIVNRSRAVEKVDLSNCATAGDGFCDTAPDYLEVGQWNCNNDLKSITLQRDPTGEVFRSDGSFIMSYARCSSRFSDEQIQAMRAHILTEKLNYLNRTQPLPSLDSLTTELLLPQKGDTIPSSGVTLEWNVVPGATNYMVELSRFSSFTSSFTDVYLTSSNFLFLDSLANNRLYYWRVKAYNPGSFCSNPSPTSTFRTGLAATTPTIEQHAKASFKIFPNPLSYQQILNIESRLPEGKRLNVRLLDVSGKVLQTAFYDAPTGEQRLQFAPGNLPRGIYVINIITDNINFTERFMIQ